MTDVREETGDIPPALSAGQWEVLRVKVTPSHSEYPHAHMTAETSPLGSRQLVIETAMRTTVRDVSEIAALIALTNAALPDEDPRKFTWETVDWLRQHALDCEAEGQGWQGDAEPLHDLADVLASYLPPRT